MSSITLGFVSTNMRKLKNTIMHPNSPRPKHRNEPVVPEKVLAKPKHEISQDFNKIPDEAQKLDKGLLKGMCNEADHRPAIVCDKAVTLPRSKTETHVSELGASDTRTTKNVIDTSSDATTTSDVTSKVRLRRRISIDPSWKAVS